MYIHLLSLNVSYLLIASTRYCCVWDEIIKYNNWMITNLGTELLFIVLLTLRFQVSWAIYKADAALNSGDVWDLVFLSKKVGVRIVNDTQKKRPNTGSNALNFTAANSEYTAIVFEILLIVTLHYVSICRLKLHKLLIVMYRHLSWSFLNSIKNIVRY